MKRVITLILSALLLIGFSAVSIPAVTAETPSYEDDTVIVAFSDFQGTLGKKTSKSTLSKMLIQVSKAGIKGLDAAFFLGDLNADENYEDPSSIDTNVASIEAIKNEFWHPVSRDFIFVQGDRDLADTPGLTLHGAHDHKSGDYGAFVISEDRYGAWDDTAKTTKQVAAEVKSYLDDKINSGWKKPIFILNHMPLHWGNRTLADGTALHGNILFDVLNKAGEKGLNIVYLFGHNNSGGYDDFLGGSAIYLKKGDQIKIAQGSNALVNTETLHFTYMNAGYITYSTTKGSLADATPTCTTFLIRGNDLYITRFSVDGVHRLKTRGFWNEHFSEKGYHAEPNLTTYLLTRKVTADDDVHLGYVFENAPTTTGTTTTRVTFPRPTVPSLITSSTAKKSTTASKATSTTTDSIGTDNTTSETLTTTNESVTPSASTDSTEPSSTTTTVPSEPNATSGDSPIGLVIAAVGAAIVLIGGSVLFVFLRRKKK